MRHLVLTKAPLLATLGLVFGSSWARAEEPRKVSEPSVLQEPAEVTNVVDAFDDNDKFDLNLTLGFQQTFPVWVYSSVRNPDHTAIVNAISTVISIIQVVLLTVALLFLRARSGDDAARGIIAGGEAVAASAET